MKTTEDKNWTLIIDAHYICYRAFYSLPKDLSFGPKDTNIIFGFLSQIRKLADEFNTNQFIFCFDSKRSYRKLIYPQYKEREDKDPATTKRLVQSRSQWDELRLDVLPGMGFRRVFHQVGYEADDLIAEIVYRCPDDYIIVTGDEDLYQLLNRGPRRETKIYNYKKVFTSQDFFMGYGIQPLQWQMVKAIAGCSSDTVAGIEGAGEVKAIQYILGTLPEGKIKERIKAGRDIIQRNLNLVSLPYCTGPRELEHFDPAIIYNEDEFETVTFMEIFRDYGFRSWLNPGELEKWKKAFNTQGAR